MTVLDKGRDAKGRDRVKKLSKGRDVMSVTTFKGRDEDTMSLRCNRKCDNNGFM